MFNKKFRLCFSIIAVTALVLGNVSAVQAGESLGSYSKRTVGSYSYNDRAAVNTDTVAGWAYTDIYTTGFVSVPTGYMGAAAQLFNASNGGLCQSSVVYYNTSSTSTLSVGSGRYIGPSSFYSMGIARYYNGSSYNNYLTTATSTVYLVSGLTATLSVPAPQLEENDEGLTLGSAYVAEVTGNMPDLVSVVTTDGQLGYAYAQDLQFDTPANPQEALALNTEAALNPSIPVYAQDGTTIIGTFQFTTVVLSKKASTIRTEGSATNEAVSTEITE